MTDRIELGCTVHFSGADMCRWRRATIVGDYVISSVGSWWPVSNTGHEPTSIGSHLYEAMVFRLTGIPVPDNGGCPCRVIADLNEVEVTRYDTPGEAHEGHEALVRKYIEAQPTEGD